LDLKDKRVLVVGLARSGEAAARLLREEGAYVILNDSKPEKA
jgi:UDP-N-acetylmuramoylalanine--D-glutamate ligase